MPLSTLRLMPRDIARKTQGQDGFAVSFPVGLFHPLQHAGLSRRTPSCPSSSHDVKACTFPEADFWPGRVSALLVKPKCTARHASLRTANTLISLRPGP